MEYSYQTERLGFRPWTMDDAEACFALSSDPHVGPPCGWRPHQTVDETRAILRGILINDFTFCIVEKATGTVIGNMGIDPMWDEMGELVPDERELGFWLGYPYWDRGYMTEAVLGTIRYCFASLGMRRLWCGYFKTNLRSKRVQEKCGFRPDHTVIRSARQLGEERETVINRLDRETWEQQSGRENGQDAGV